VLVVPLGLTVLDAAHELVTVLVTGPLTGLITSPA